MVIIVSQKKDCIVNFDNVIQIFIKYCKNDQNFAISCEYTDSLCEELGYYKTEERAKEVLQEIVNKHLSCIKTGGEVNIGYDRATVVPEQYYTLPKIYTMPEE